MDKKPLKLSGNMVTIQCDKVGVQVTGLNTDSITYQEAVEKFTNYMMTDRLCKRDVWDYSTILAILFDKPKEQTLQDLFDAQRS